MIWLLLNKDWGGFPLELMDLDDGSRSSKVMIDFWKEHIGMFPSVRLVSIPDGSFYTIDDYDGVETCYYSASEIFCE